MATALHYNFKVVKEEYKGTYAGPLGFWELFIHELRGTEKFASIRSGKNISDSVKARAIARNEIILALAEKAGVHSSYLRGLPNQWNIQSDKKGAVRQLVTTMRQHIQGPENENLRSLFL